MQHACEAVVVLVLQLSAGPEGKDMCPRILKFKVLFFGHDPEVLWCYFFPRPSTTPLAPPQRSLPPATHATPSAAQLMQDLRLDSPP